MSGLSGVVDRDATSNRCCVANLSDVTIQARPARKADIRALSHVLGRAFYDDPVSRWILRDDNGRAADQGKFFAAMTRHHHLAGGGAEVAGDGRSIGAAALWDPPGRWKHSRGERFMMTPSLIRGFGLRPAVGRRLDELVDGLKRQHPEDAFTAGPLRRRALPGLPRIQ
jgi:hypothetical protein